MTASQPERSEPGATIPAWRALARPGTAVPRPRLRLTGRGGMVAVFACSFAGVFAAQKLHVGALAGMSYAAACVLVAGTVRRTQLLPVVTAPPMLFGGAVICVQFATAGGGLLAQAGGVVVTLGNAAPWLFAGTVCAALAALARGLQGNVRTLRQGLRGDDAGAPQPEEAKSPPQ